MPRKSRFQVPVVELERVHLEPDDLVEEVDPTPPNPDIKSKADRDRESAWRAGSAP